MAGKQNIKMNVAVSRDRNICLVGIAWSVRKKPGSLRTCGYAYNYTPDDNHDDGDCVASALTSWAEALEQSGVTDYSVDAYIDIEFGTPVEKQLGPGLANKFLIEYDYAARDHVDNTAIHAMAAHEAALAATGHARSFKYRKIHGAAVAIFENGLIRIGIAWNDISNDPWLENGKNRYGVWSHVYDVNDFDSLQDAILEAAEAWEEGISGQADSILLFVCRPSDDGHDVDVLRDGEFIISWGLCGSGDLWDNNKNAGRHDPLASRAHAAKLAAGTKNHNENESEDKTMDEKNIRKTTMNCNIVAIEDTASGRVSVGMSWNDPCIYPADVDNVDSTANVFEGENPADAAREMAVEFADMAHQNGWVNCMVFIDAGIDDKPATEKCGTTNILWGVCHNDGTSDLTSDPMNIRAHAARRAAQDALDAANAVCDDSARRPLNIIITAGPTNERVDAVMKITNMSTGKLGARIAEAMLNADGQHAHVAEKIGRIYYISPKLAVKPVVPDGQAYKLELVQIESAEDLLQEIARICNNNHVDVIVHSCAVGDYKARYSARAEDIAKEIATHVADIRQVSDVDSIASAVLYVLKHPACVADDATKMSSYEPNLFTMMDLTPKVISKMRELAPNAIIFGFKLLENVSKQHLFGVASALRQKNSANYIIANDLAQIKNGKHPAMVVGYDHVAGCDAIFAECEDKAGIADTICNLAFGPANSYQAGDIKADSANPGTRTCWHVVAANNMNTDVRIEGFSSDKKQAWLIMAEHFRETVHEMLPDVKIGHLQEPSWEFEDEHRRASISDDAASVYDGEDMWYYNLVPMSYTDVN